MFKKSFFAFAVLLSIMLLGTSFLTPARVLAQTADPVFVGAGDISSCGHNNDEATAKLLDNISGTVFTLGDNVYPDGAPQQYTDCFAPTWGRHKSRIRPAPGNHDYHTAGGGGYFSYYGAASTPLEPNCTANCKGYYSYNLGAWHIIALNSEIDHTASSAQLQWLKADLAANTAMCTLAYWHEPRFSSGQHGNNNGVAPYWDALYSFGADVILNGHDHTYQRFAPQSPSAQADPNHGIREFVVGTGGAGLYAFPTNQPNTEVRNNTTFGVLKLTLHAASYSWQFVPVAGQTFTDSGTANCVDAATGGTGATRTPTRTPTKPPAPTFTFTPTKTATLVLPSPTFTRTTVPSNGTATNTPVFTSTATNSVPPTLTFTPATTTTIIPAGNTNTPTPTSVPASPTLPTGSSDLIFADSFASGNFSAWSSGATDNGDLSVIAGQSLPGGANWMQAVLDDNRDLYVTDDHPNAEKHYRARFYFNPNSIKMGSGNTHFIFVAYSGNATAILKMELRLANGNYELRVKVLNDNLIWVLTDWVPITNAPHSIELDWQASTKSGAKNGAFTFWIDGAQKAALAAIDNDTLKIDRVRLGAVAGMDTLTRGKYYFAAFESRRQSYIGPLGSGTTPPSPTPTSVPPTATPTQVAGQTATATSVISASPTPTATQAPPTPTSTITATPPAGSVKIVFASSNEDIANPERGFMKQSSIFPDQALDPNKIRALNPTDTLVWIYFRLDNYRTKPLDQQGLNTIRAAFATARSKGLKLVIRFAYNPGPGSTTDPNQANPDAPLDLVLQHISQLKPILAENSDVIAVMQVGFVGYWGEWHSTKYLAPLESRKAIVDAVLQALPKDRMVQLRYPRYKEIFYKGPLTSLQAFTGTDQSRVGHHNDCFLRDQDDGGTYKSTTAQEPKSHSPYCDGKDEVSCWKGYVSQETQFTPMGGETCQYNPPRTDCPNTLQEMAMLHWSFINNDYRPEVLNGWTAQGCMSTIRRSLGYRLVLKDAYVTPTLKPGGTLSLNVHLTNVGFASMFNPRPIYVVLIGPSGRFELPLTNVDPRRWAAGQDQAITVTANLPANIAPGTYKLGLWLPDAYASLRSTPAYAVRFANTNVWDAATGINMLTTIQVAP